MFVTFIHFLEYFVCKFNCKFDENEYNYFFDDCWRKREGASAGERERGRDGARRVAEVVVPPSTLKHASPVLTTWTTFV